MTARPHRRGLFTHAAVAIGALTALGIASGCGGSGDGASSDPNAITVYSGREEDIVAPLFTAFTAATGVPVEVRYGKSSELAAQIDEEGDSSPADVFFSQDAGSLGVLSERFAPLPKATLARVPASFRDPSGKWTGTSGRVRVVAYNTDAYTAADLPNTVDEYATPRFAARMGIAPSNASFQAFVTAMRIKEGDERTRSFLVRLKDGGVKTFENNRAIVEAIADGDVDLGLVNHYYLALVKKERPDAKVANKYLAPGDPGALVNVAGVGILETSDKKAAARKLVDYLLSKEGQQYYTKDAEETEYPLVAGVPAAPGLPPLASLTGESAGLSTFGAQEKATLELITEVGLTS